MLCIILLFPPDVDPENAPEVFDDDASVDDGSEIDASAEELAVFEADDSSAELALPSMELTASEVPVSDMTDTTSLKDPSPDGSQAVCINKNDNTRNTQINFLISGSLSLINHMFR
ncbi:hypothetical protein EOM86_04015 [Candidatus Nomurabacteria bacterium]|nr:hypothetical protein [Candidatus Nomurabacteria bacterium]